jgi:hypothetical protein
MSSNPQNDQWYSNKELFEMLQDLKEDLHNTRMDLRKYNDLRGAIAELQKTQLAQSEACKRHISDPEGIVHKMQDQITSLKLQVEGYKNKDKGRKSVEDSFLRWGGWIFGLAGMVISIIKILSP